MPDIPGIKMSMITKVRSQRLGLCNSVFTVFRLSNDDEFIVGFQLVDNAKAYKRMVINN